MPIAEANRKAPHQGALPDTPLLDGRRFLIVMGSYEGKRVLYERARELGASLVVLDGPGHWSQGEVGSLFEHFLEVDLYPQHSLADRALAALRDSRLNFDGVATVEDAAGPLTAILAQSLGKPGHSVLAVAYSRDKTFTREVCSEAGIPSPRHYRVRSAADLEAASSHVGFPAVLKPVSGMSSASVYIVHDMETLKARYRSTMANVEQHSVTTGVNSDNEDALIWAKGRDMTLEEYLDGEEFDVDCLLSGGQMVYSAVSYNPPQPHAKETGAWLPSSFAREIEEPLVGLADQCLRVMGFQDGVFHVEAKYTSQGARLLEVNARLGGGFQYQLNRWVWGVDLMESYLLTCLGFPIAPVASSSPLTYLAEVDFTTVRSGIVSSSDFLSGIVDDPQMRLHKYEAKAGQHVTGPEDGVPDWLYSLIVSGSSTADAVAHAAHLSARIPDVVAPAPRESQFK